MNLIRTESNQLVIDDIGQELHNRFSYIKFNSAEHRYFNDQGHEYNSVSEVLENFIAPFDLEYYSGKASREVKIPQEEIKTVWDIRREYSMLKGTEFHLYAQTFLNHKRKIDLQTPITGEIASFHRFWTKIKDRCKIIATELIVADDEYKIAGTVDCVIQNRKTEKYFIFDWKTNRKITEKNPISKKMLPPVNSLDSCSFSKYSLQMSFYKFLINKNTNLQLKQAYIVHFTPQGYKVYSPQYYQEEVKAMIDSYRKNEQK